MTLDKTFRLLSKIINRMVRYEYNPFNPLERLEFYDLIKLYDIRSHIFKEIDRKYIHLFAKGE